AIAQATCVLEFAFARLRLPRRHHATRGHGGNLRRPPLDVVVGDQTERPDLARPMTGRAARPPDRCDVPGERETRLSVARDRPTEQTPAPQPQKSPRTQSKGFSPVSAHS